MRDWPGDIAEPLEGMALKSGFRGPTTLSRNAFTAHNGLLNFHLPDGGII